MSATVKVTLGEVESVYRCTYPLARAIEVILHHSDCAEEIEQKPCEDAISRQAAIYACKNGWNKDFKEIMEDIKKLPPVKPEPCEDAISRQAVLDEIDKRFDLAKSFKQLIKSMPSVTPTEKVGKWIPVSERLPEKNDVYLVAINSYGCPTRDVDGFVSQSVRKWEMYGKSVVAWMPLPEPYKASPTGAERSDKE